MTHNRITQLPKQVFEKIAAGEVVTGPLSVVKELVENAIDAGASAITVEIREGGKNYIRVADDGSGIRREDVELAFMPHATSKILGESDLDRIGTLGFRGEALSSIAAVSRLKMVTKTADAKTGSAISTDGGHIGEVKEVGAADGTTIIVEDIYFNTPARLKFMKSDRAESSAIIDFLSKIAVAYPHIRIKMVNNNNILFSTNGKGDVLQAVLTVYGTSGSEGLIPVEGETEHMSLKALISGPNNSRKNRRSQILFVNGRYVTDETIARAIAEAYKEYMFEGRFPIVYLFLQIDPSLVDVNVHPAKSEIRFFENRSVGTFIKNTILSKLASKEGIPNMPTGNKWSPKEAWEQRKKEIEFYALKDDADAPEKKTPKGRNPVEISSDDEYVETVNIKTLWSNDSPDVDLPKVSDDLSGVAYDAEKPAAANLSDAPISEKTGAETRPNAPIPVTPMQHEMNIDSLQVFGSVFATYLLATDADSFYIVDQHAAHERVNYERFLNQYRSADKLIQQILTPAVCKLPAAAKSSVDSWAAWLTGLGFETELFGDNTVIVKTFPAFLPYTEAEIFLRDIIENAAAEPPDNDKAIERLISRACKQSVKANDTLKNDEIAMLLRDLSRCANPYTCPHGRPVFIRMGKRDLERMFKRI
ncbi:MAG: DNA mismatch repair endonuclease MutL [Clostridiales Family XIII bacterium]|jgi:DNA mismatch repair protein MutL|nr:DNA mismatch repair endonuclease MutL [Clostridiales Family XIII bacterium]